MKFALTVALLFMLTPTALAIQRNDESSKLLKISDDPLTNSTQQEAGEEPKTAAVDNETGLTSIPMPSKKDCHPNGYYDVWLAELKTDERFLESNDTRKWAMTAKHWGRFLWYFKMVPDDPQRILDIFMDAYRYDKHSFCAKYEKWVPRLIADEHEYCLEFYKSVKPAMDEIVRLVLDSYDGKLLEQFVEIQKSDQVIRANIPENATPEEQKELLAKQREIDIENLKQIEQVISKHGYPGRSLVGTRYEEVAFLVIQHSGGDVIEKHLPTIKAAIDRNDLEASVYPYLFDRLEVSKGRAQHFGTQRKLENNELFPVHDPENLNQRRQQYGLPPIEPRDSSN